MPYVVPPVAGRRTLWVDAVLVHVERAAFPTRR
jgi:hypothetical protein